MLEVGVLKNFDSGTYKAGVQLAGSLTTYFDDISVAKNIPSGAMVIGNYVILAIPGVNPKDACVIATWPSGSSGAIAELDDIGDVNVPSPSDNDVLYWDNSASKWKNRSKGEFFHAVATPEDIYYMQYVSASPRTATISGVAGDTITLTGNHAYRFFHTQMAGNVYLKIANSSKNPVEYAWVKDKPANNKLQVTDSGDISGWSNGDTITTETQGNDKIVELDISPLVPEGATGIFIRHVVRGSTSAQEKSCISASGAPGTWQFNASQVQDYDSYAYPFTSIDENRHVMVQDQATGTDTIRVRMQMVAYVKP